MMATFADGGVPPVLSAIKAAKIPSYDLFKFNNSSLWAKQNDKFAQVFWKMGVWSFEDFFCPPQDSRNQKPTSDQGGAKRV